MERQPIALLENQLRGIFDDLAGGDDVAPARRYRAEGFADALVAMGRMTLPEFHGFIAVAYQRAYGNDLPEHFLTGTDADINIGSETGECRIPGVMKRAPVYPSTKD